MDDSLIKAILVSVIVYAIALVGMVGLLVIGLAFVGTSQTIALPVRLVLHAVAVVIGIAWAGRFSGLSGANAWMALSIGTTIGSLTVVVAYTYLDSFLGAFVAMAGAVLPWVGVLWTRRQHARANPR